MSDFINMRIKSLLRGSMLVVFLLAVGALAQDSDTTPKSDSSSSPSTTDGSSAPATGSSESGDANKSPSTTVSTPANGDKTSTDKSTPLNTGLKPNQADDMIPSVYKDMVVVQRKAKQKAGRILFAPSVSLDFSDGPITQYAVNTNIGYAFSDFWEVYANIVPTFIVVPRPIINKVQQLQTVNGPATITYAKPVSQFGGEILWAPAYGKESWGPFSIVRSDTFFKLQVAETNFAGGSSGMRYSLVVGKTYFISKYANLRADAGIAYIQSVVDGTMSGDWAPVLDLGLVYYF
jgi:hypothetical protein